MKRRTGRRVATYASGFMVSVVTAGTIWLGASALNRVSQNTSSAPIENTRGIAIAHATSPVAPGAGAPDGMSDSQRAAQYAAEQAAWASKLATWLATLDLAKIDMRVLPRTDLLADLVPGKADLQQAVAAADRIVVGEVATIRPTTGGTTEVTLTVTKTIKGPAASTVVFAQYGGLQPKADWSGPSSILQLPGQQLLLPGDYAILLLQAWSNGYYIQPISGFYLLVRGGVQPDSLNAWGASVTGLSEAAFVALLYSETH